MNCKHCNEKGHCTLLNKNANEISCRNCVMKLPKDYGQELINMLFKNFGDKGVK